MEDFTKLFIVILAVTALSFVAIAYVTAESIDEIYTSKHATVVAKNQSTLSVTLDTGEVGILNSTALYDMVEVNQNYILRGMFNWYTKTFTITEIANV